MRQLNRARHLPAIATRDGVEIRLATPPRLDGHIPRTNSTVSDRRGTEIDIGPTPETRKTDAIVDASLVPAAGVQPQQSGMQLARVNSVGQARSNGGS